MHNKTIYRVKLVLLFSWWIMSTCYGQNGYTSNTTRIEAQIDSVAKKLNITIATVCVKEVSSFREKTSTYTECLVRLKEFTINNGFLQMEDSFFNLEKLLYFKIEEDKKSKQRYLEFYFQYY